MDGREECEYSGGEWVTTYRKSDGTLVRPFCRKIGTKRDRNGNTKDEWRREKGDLFDMREYTLQGGDIEGTVKKDLRNNKVRWFVDFKGVGIGRRIAEGTSTNVGMAKAKVEEEMKRK